MEIKKFVSLDMDENCYAVTVNEECFIVDPGEFSKELESFALENKERIKYILLTHCHFDHIMGVFALKNVCKNALVVAHSMEIDGLRSPNINLSQFFCGQSICLIADKTVEDGESFKVGTENISVLHTPGHTKGSVCYKIGNILFSGDTLFKKSYGRTDFPGGSMLELKHSLEKLSTLEGDIKVCCGHGQDTTIKEEFNFR